MIRNWIYFDLIAIINTSTFCSRCISRIDCNLGNTYIQQTCTVSRFFWAFIQSLLYIVFKSYLTQISLTEWTRERRRNRRMRKMEIPFPERLTNYTELPRCRGLRLLICFSHVLYCFATLRERERHTKDQDLHKRSTELARVITSRTIYSCNKQNQFHVRHASTLVIKSVDLQLF